MQRNGSHSNRTIAYNLPPTVSRTRRGRMSTAANRLLRQTPIHTRNESSRFGTKVVVFVAERWVLRFNVH